MKLNGKKVIVTKLDTTSYFSCNGIQLKFIHALKILKEIEDIKRMYVYEGILKRDIFNMDVDVNEFKKIFEL